MSDFLMSDFFYAVILYSLLTYFLLTAVVGVFTNNFTLGRRLTDQMFRSVRHRPGGETNNGVEKKSQNL